jgi:glycolate oxidase iron-sulfur subunit
MERAKMLDTLDDLQKALRRCNKCGFCQAGCPIYKVTGVEWNVARGRIALVRDAFEGRVELGKELEDPVYTCLTCNGCVDHCPPGAQTGSIILRTREELQRRYGRPLVQRLIFDAMLPNPDVMGAAVWMARLGQLSGMTRLMEASGVMGDLGKAQSVLPALPAIRGREAIKKVLKQVERPRARVAYFMGCAADLVTPDVAVSAVRFLQSQQVQVDALPFVCCGKPPMAYGDAGSARELAKRNINAMGDREYDAIVAPCATCGSFLKEYGELLANDEGYYRRAASFASSVRDFSKFVDGLGLVGEPRELKRRVTYHDPCHLGRYQKVTAQPRSLLKSIPGMEFKELPESNMCCGAAGSFSLSHYELSMRVLDRKMENVKRTEADMVVTSCPGCTIQLSAGVRRHGLPARAVELVQLLDEAYSRD